MTPSSPPSLPVEELFIKYLEFLKEIGIQEISLSQKSKNFLNGSTVKGSTIKGSAPRSKNSKEPPVFPATVVSGSQGVGPFLWSGVPVSRLVCVCEKLCDEAAQQLADQKLCDIIEKGMALALSDVAICKVEPFAGHREQGESWGAELRSKIISSDPLVILSMGDVASAFLLQKKIDVFRERGTWGEFEGIKVMPTLHPDFIVKNYTTKIRRDVFDDIKKVKGVLTKT